MGGSKQKQTYLMIRSLIFCKRILPIKNETQLGLEIIKGDSVQKVTSILLPVMNEVCCNK
jgi:hypothetical protein